MFLYNFVSTYSNFVAGILIGVRAVALSSCPTRNCLRTALCLFPFSSQIVSTVQFWFARVLKIWLWKFSFLLIANYVRVSGKLSRYYAYVKKLFQCPLITLSSCPAFWATIVWFVTTKSVIISQGKGINIH